MKTKVESYQKYVPIVSVPAIEFLDVITNISDNDLLDIEIDVDMETANQAMKLVKTIENDIVRTYYEGVVQKWLDMFTTAETKGAV